MYAAAVNGLAMRTELHRAIELGHFELLYQPILPRPVDPAVSIRQLSARQLVALRFTGQPSAERETAAERAITDFVRANGLTASGPFAVAGYDGPDVPEARQHWEVHQPVG